MVFLELNFFGCRNVGGIFLVVNANTQLHNDVRFNISTLQPVYSDFKIEPHHHYIEPCVVRKAQQIRFF